MLDLNGKEEKRKRKIKKKEGNAKKKRSARDYEAALLKQKQDLLEETAFQRENSPKKIPSENFLRFSSVEKKSSE